MSMSNLHTLQLGGVTEAMAREFERGRNVMILDGAHSNPDHLRLLGDPAALERFSRAGVRDVVIEDTPSIVNEFRQWQQQGLSRDEIRDRLRENPDRYLSDHTRDTNRRGDEIEQRADMIHHTGRLGMTLHGFENMDTYRDQLQAQLPAQDRETLDNYYASIRGQRAVHPDNIPANVLEIEARLDQAADDYRFSGHDPMRTAPNDARLADEISGAIGNRPALIAYGAQHGYGGRDLDELLAARTGRPTQTVGMANDPIAQFGAHDTLEQRGGAIDAPDIVYDSQTGEVRRTTPSAQREGRQQMREQSKHFRENGELRERRDAGCVMPENWMSSSCSTQSREPAQRLRRAGLEDMQDVPPVQLGELSPPPTPGMERNREMGIV
ncbi:MAG: hypothetical protein K2Q12_11280 [Rickettsiales bacterium]|nr:hypothetical protein [Rickettsiales bacterium]